MQPPSSGVGVGVGGALHVKVKLIVPRVPVPVLQKLILALQLGSGPGEVVQLPPIIMSPSASRFFTSAPQSSVLGVLPDRQEAGQENGCSVGQGNCNPRSGFMALVENLGANNEPAREFGNDPSLWFLCLCIRPLNELFKLNR